MVSLLAHQISSGEIRLFWLQGSYSILPRLSKALEFCHVVLSWLSSWPWPVVIYVLHIWELRTRCWRLHYCLLRLCWLPGFCQLSAASRQDHPLRCWLKSLWHELEVLCTRLCLGLRLSSVAIICISSKSWDGLMSPNCVSSNGRIMRHSWLVESCDQPLLQNSVRLIL